MPKKTQRRNGGHHTQGETRGEGETSRKRLGSSIQEGGGKAGRGWEGDPAEKERQTIMERGIWTLGGVWCED